MVRKTSTSSKVKKRKEAYKRQLKADSIPSDCVNFVNKDMPAIFSDVIKMKEQFDDYKIIKDVIKKLVSKVSRLDNERNRQLQIRNKKKIEATISNEKSILKRTRQIIWFKTKYQNVLFRKKENERAIKYFRDKYHNNNDFREKQKSRIKEHILVKYHKNTNFRVKNNARASRRILNKYHTNKTFRDKVKTQSNIHILNKYHTNKTFRDKVKKQSNIHILNKYHTNKAFRDEYKERMKTQFSEKYKSNKSIRLRTIERTLNWYRNNNTSERKNLRRLYNHSRRVMKKYTIIQSHKYAAKHRNLYMDNLNRFRQIVREGPDYVCVSCQLALFRNQVVPFVEKKYTKQNMSDEIKTRIQSYFNYSSSGQNKWICKSCSDKIKKRQMPSRAIVNKLKVCEVPFELKELNNLEKHLIALRLPFMKIVNLTS
ncbi:unnamed protein product, partial [Rotaria sp. Silwood1]